MDWQVIAQYSFQPWLYESLPDPLTTAQHDVVTDDPTFHSHPHLGRARTPTRRPTRRGNHVGGKDSKPHSSPRSTKRCAAGRSVQLESCYKGDDIWISAFYDE